MNKVIARLVTFLRLKGLCTSVVTSTSKGGQLVIVPAKESPIK